MPRFKVNRAALSASFIEPDPWNVTSSMGGAFLGAPVRAANKSPLERTKTRWRDVAGGAGSRG